MKKNNEGTIKELIKLLDELDRIKELQEEAQRAKTYELIDETDKLNIEVKKLMNAQNKDDKKIKKINKGFNSMEEEDVIDTILASTAATFNIIDRDIGNMVLIIEGTNGEPSILHTGKVIHDLKDILKEVLNRLSE